MSDPEVLYSWSRPGFARPHLAGGLAKRLSSARPGLMTILTIALWSWQFCPVYAYFRARTAVENRASCLAPPFLRATLSIPGALRCCSQVPVENAVQSSQPSAASKWHCGCYGYCKAQPRARCGVEAMEKKGDVMREPSVRLGPREQQIVELLLQGCDNAEIASQLKMARRTVKAHFNRLFLRFGINDGIKRVKLATLLYRRQTCLQMDAMGPASPVNVNRESSSSLPKA
jgi:regulatory LuxR family protein